MYRIIIMMEGRAVMVRTQISMTGEQASGLAKLAATRKRSQAALLREALDSLLSSSERSARAERARDAIGRHGSKHPDTAKRHDEVLEEAYNS